MTSERVQKRLAVSDCQGLLAESTSDEVRVWNVLSGRMLHEFRPSRHLASMVSCVALLNVSDAKVKSKQSSVLLIGSKTGEILVYDWAREVIMHKWQTKTKSEVSSLESAGKEIVAVLSIDAKMSLWNFKSGLHIKDMDAGGGSSLCWLGGELMAVASQRIQTLDMANTNLLASYAGHDTQTTCLVALRKDKGSVVDRFLSASVNDVYVHVWNADRAKIGGTQSPLVSLKAKEGVCSVAACEGGAAVVSGTGKLRVYNLVGSSRKPVRPQCCLSLFRDEAHLAPLPIARVVRLDQREVTIAYGLSGHLKFETIKLSTMDAKTKWVRDTPVVARGADLHLLRSDINQGKATHVTPAFMPPTQPVSGKRSAPGDDAPAPPPRSVEELLSHTLGEKGKTRPNSKNLASALLQGLQSDDKKLLRRAFSCTSVEIVRNSVRDIPSSEVYEVLLNLQGRLEVDWHRSKSYRIWYNQILEYHRAEIVSRPDCLDLLTVFQSYEKKEGDIAQLLVNARARHALVRNNNLQNERLVCLEYAPLLAPQVDSDDEMERESGLGTGEGMDEESGLETGPETSSIGMSEDSGNSGSLISGEISEKMDAESEADLNSSDGE